MKRLIVAGLIAVNVGAAGLCAWLAVGSSHAQHVGVDVTDLRYGAVDADGDGVYSAGDDQVAQWLVTNSPGVLALPKWPEEHPFRYHLGSQRRGGRTQHSGGR